MRRISLVLAILACVLSACDPTAKQPTRQSTKIENIAPYSNPALNQIVNDQQIKFMIGTGPVNYSNQIMMLSSLGVPDQATVDKFIPMLVKELSLYPPGTLKKMGIDTLVLTQRANVAIKSGETFLQPQPRTAVPLFTERAVTLDVGLSHKGQEFLASIIHHEFFHQADYVADLTVQKDPNWENLNYQGFSYGSGGQGKRWMGVATWDDALQGILNEYSQTALEEDKAEIFAALMWAPEDLRRRAKTDSALANKGRSIISFLNGLDPQFNADFFATISAKRAAFAAPSTDYYIYTPYGYQERRK